MEILGNAVDVPISMIDADFEDIGCVEALDTAQTFRCTRNQKNCGMENVLNCTIGGLSDRRISTKCNKS